MSKKTKKAPAVDWRKLPRKPAASKKTARVTLAITEANRDALRTAARRAGKTLVEYVLERCGLTP